MLNALNAGHSAPLEVSQASHICEQVICFHKYLRKIGLSLLFSIISPDASWLCRLAPLFFNNIPGSNVKKLKTFSAIFRESWRKPATTVIVQQLSGFERQGIDHAGGWDIGELAQAYQHTSVCLHKELTHLASVVKTAKCPRRVGWRTVKQCATLDLRASLRASCPREALKLAAWASNARLCDQLTVQLL